MGKGALRADGTSYEACINTHGAPLGGDAYTNTIKHLGGDPENPFVIFDDVKELYAKRAEELKKIVAERKAAEAEWRKANPEKSAQMDEWFSGKAPKVDWSKIEQKAGSATRAASAACLGVLAEQVPNMICASADLSNSDKTDGFLKKTKSMVRGDFSGAFFQAGVAELTMADVYRYDASRWRDSSNGYILCILRLYETSYSYRSLDAGSCQVHLDSRCIPCG